MTIVETEVVSNVLSGEITDRHASTKIPSCANFMNETSVGPGNGMIEWEVFTTLHGLLWKQNKKGILMFANKSKKYDRSEHLRFRYSCIEECS